MDEITVERGERMEAKKGEEIVTLSAEDVYTAVAEWYLRRNKGVVTQGQSHILSRIEDAKEGLTSAELVSFSLRFIREKQESNPQ